MMTTLNDRERALEEKFHHDQSQNFKILSKRNKIFGLWVAEKRGLETGEAEEYARLFVNLLLQENSNQALITKALHDLGAAGFEVTQAELEKGLGQAEVQASEAVHGS